jgi:hypothetical protein
LAFEPSKIPEDQCVQGHLDADPIYDVLLRVHGAKVSGRLTTEDASGPNHLYFMQGKPVGVQLAEYVHPLGQLLLELGRINGQTFVRAQRYIAEGNRLAGQVFKELGVLDDDSLKEVLVIQARKKVEHYCRLGSRAFTFCRGMTWLTGFNSTPLDLFAVAYLAVRAQLGPDARAAWIDAARDQQVRVVNAAGDPFGLPASLQTFGFGPPEERFLQRIVGGWEKVSELVENGTLPAEDAAVLLRYLEVIGRLERRAPPAPVPAHVSALTEQPAGVARLAVPEGFDDVFSSSGGVPAAPAAQRAPVPPPDSVFAGPSEATDPRRSSIHEQNTVPFGDVTAEQPAPTSRPVFRSVLAEEQPPPSIVVSDELPAPVVKKKKVRRTEPLPSEGAGMIVSETRKEKTMISPMPTIVIDED